MRIIGIHSIRTMAHAMGHGPSLHKAPQLTLIGVTRTANSSYTTLNNLNIYCIMRGTASFPDPTQGL